MTKPLESPRATACRLYLIAPMLSGGLVITRDGVRISYASSVESAKSIIDSILQP